MTDLSPAAQAVLDAGLPHVVHRYSIAAALRAAADQMGYSKGPGGFVVDVDELNAIAAELEGA